MDKLILMAHFTIQRLPKHLSHPAEPTLHCSSGIGILVGSAQLLQHMELINSRHHAAAKQHLVRNYITNRIGEDSQLYYEHSCQCSQRYRIGITHSTIWWDRQVCFAPPVLLPLTNDVQL
jgi:hypothetical protein